MALTAIQTEKWRQTIEAFLTTQTIASRITDNAISIDGGDTFHVVNPTDVSTFTVDDTSDITYSLPTDTDVSLTKNFDKGFGLLMLDTNKMQTTLQGWERAYANNGAYQLAADLDTAVFADHASWTNNYEVSTTDWQFTATTLLDIPTLFSGIMEDMRDNAVDNKGQPYIVVNPALANLIEQYSAARATDFGDQQLLAGGSRMFKFMGFNVYVSNRLTTVSTTLHCMAGIEGYGVGLGVYALPSTFEVQRSEGRFGDIIRGRVAAAHKVTRTVAVYDVNVNTTMTA